MFLTNHRLLLGDGGAVFAEPEEDRFEEESCQEGKVLAWSGNCIFLNNMDCM